MYNAVLLAATAMLTQAVPTDGANALDVESPSGRLWLRVDPGDRFGAGASRIRLTRDGEPLFDVELAFTFQKVAVTDLGYVVGYGDTSARFGGREFIVGVVAPDGRVIWEERTKRMGSLGPSRPSRPHATGLFVDPGGKWFVVRVMDLEGKLGELWWRYSIQSSGSREVLSPIRCMDSSDGVFYRILDAKVLPGTTWILVHWWRMDSRGGFLEAPVIGAVFTLVDADSAVKWRLDLPDDYSAGRDDAARYKRVVRQSGGILDVSSGGRFALWKLKDDLRVEYEVELDTESERGLRVRETARRSFVPAERQRKPWNLSRHHLRLVSEVRLVSDVPLHALRDIVDFGFGKDGLPVAIRRDSNMHYTAVHVGADGSETREVPLGPMPEVLSKSVGFHELRPGEWLVVVRSGNENARRVWLLADVETGGVRRLLGIDATWLDSVPTDVLGAAGTEGGGLVVLCNSQSWSGIGTRLLSFDARERLLWKVDEHHDDPTQMFDPTDVTVLPDGRVALLENSGSRILLYGDEGGYYGSIDLTESMGREPNHIVSIHTDSVGALLVHEFRGDPPLWRLLSTGGVVGRITPDQATDYTMDLLSRCARPGPDGWIWTTDGCSLYALGDNGRVARTVGTEANEMRLDLPGRAAIDSLGRTWIRDRRTGALHGFDSEGHKVFVASFASEDGHPKRWLGRVIARPDGGILVEREGQVYVRFDKNGRRLGQTPTDCGAVYLELEGERFLTCEYFEPLRIRDAKGAVIQEVKKYPDGGWSGRADDAVLGNDGAGAVLVAGSVLLLDDDGAPNRQIPVPRRRIFGGRIFVGGGRVLVSGREPEGLLFSLDDNRWETVKVGDIEDGVHWSVALLPDGRGVLAVNNRTYTLRKFELE